MIRTPYLDTEASEYRYTLDRTDDASLWFQMHAPRVLWIMLNPSTADETLDDPTIRRVRGFTHRLGSSGFTVVNLYAYRATKPADLWKAADPVGPDNDPTIRMLAFTARMEDAPIIAAWGANAKPERVAEVLALPHVGDLHCLGITKDGAPRHPLYLPLDAPLIPWTPVGKAVR